MCQGPGVKPHKHPSILLCGTVRRATHTGADLQSLLLPRELSSFYSLQFQAELELAQKTHILRSKPVQFYA
ncbi:hypothetical protein EYF80_047338 [Liparis tanakae]|uniref:Uncharacterized protein n=1 Tax=Liparis tanakae TaxID=230148 RepID=A0A4Z2FNZ3_9TELE|nr:hypothetical protein EYF80_047338 [Liparis tanakae]